MKKFILFALLAFLLPSSAWSYDVGEVFTVSIDTIDFGGLWEETIYMTFKRIENSDRDVPQCIVYGEPGNPAIVDAFLGPGFSWYTLSNIEIPSSIEGMDVVGISSYAFAECQNIKYVYLAHDDNPHQRESQYFDFVVGENAFYNCTQLDYFDVSNYSDYYEDGTGNTDASHSVILEARAFYNCSSLTSITATQIGEEALAGTSIENIWLSGSDYTKSFIGNYAFSTKNAVESKKSINLYLDKTVKDFSFAKDAFAGCNIESIDVNYDNPTYGGRNSIIDNEGNLILGRNSLDLSETGLTILPNAFPCHVDKMVISEYVTELYIDAFRDCDTLVIEGTPHFYWGYDYEELGYIEPKYGEVYLPVEAYGHFLSYYSEYVSGNLHPFLNRYRDNDTFILPYMVTRWEGKKSMWFKVPTGWKAYIPLYMKGNVVMKNVDTIVSGEGVVLVHDILDGDTYLDIHVSNNDADEYYDKDAFDGNLLRSYIDNRTDIVDPYYDYYQDNNYYKVPSIYDEKENYRFSQFNREDSTFLFTKIARNTYANINKFRCYMAIPLPKGQENPPTIYGCLFDSAKFLTVDVTDEFTYYTERAPHVKNATVVVYEKDSKNEIQRGKTGKDGTVSFENLPIGDYIIHVEAAEHESKDYEYHREADEDETVEITISYTGGVTCEFIVEETSVPDLYHVSVNYTYEADIPLPFVSLSVPKSIRVDDMAVGESIEFQATLYNNGFIRVNDVALQLPDNIPFMSFEPQQAYQGLSIEAKQSFTITVKATKTAAGDCKDALWGAAWSYPVGESTAYKNYHNIRMSMGECPKNIEEVEDIVSGHSSGGNSGQGDDTGKGSFKDSKSITSYQEQDGTKTENVSTDKPFTTVSVDVKINQALSLTRQAFRGTMIMKNAYPASIGAIKDIRFNLAIVDTETGKTVTSKEFEVQLDTLSGFVGEQTMNGPWNLASGKQGEVSVLMIPTKYAAPTKEKKFKLVPSLSYIDPLLSMANPDEGRKEENLIPKTITVNPTPQLVLDYFIPKKIVGDDPMTEDVVEASEPAELGLLIRNEGYGEAKNLKITTKQPEIVDNRDSLLIDFAITGGTVNGKDVQMTEGKELVSDFGTLKARSTAYAQWWLTSTLLGRITKYNVSYFQETDYDNENFSLLSAVNAHTLIRSIKQDDLLFGFLTDKQEARVFQFYGADGSKENVQSADDIDVTKKTHFSYVVRFVVPDSGYIYGYIQDPTDGEGKLKGDNLIDYWRENVRFSDEAPSRWMKAPAMHEKTIHFVCRVPEANQAYELTLDMDAPDQVNSVVTTSEKDEWYTLSGLRVSKPNAKGVYIHNGRKVLVR